jgi:hypothetical protein
MCVPPARTFGTVPRIEVENDGPADDEPSPVTLFQKLKNALPKLKLGTLRVTK